ncbi:uncharacterized protein LOC144572606 [Carex rostrata]
MDFSNKIMALALVILSLSMALPSTLAQVTCEKLDEEECAFAVSSASKRCILESTPQSRAYQCKTSDVVVEKISNHIEMMSCLGACGLERRTVGISSDALMDPNFTQKLCSEACSEHCPNIIDLYSNLASGEGTTLSTLCEKQRTNPRRAMEELSSSGAAPGPASGGEAEAPSPSA